MSRLDLALKAVMDRQVAAMTVRMASWSGPGEGVAFHRTDLGSGDELVRQAALAEVPTGWAPGRFHVQVFGSSVNRPYFPDRAGRRWMLDGSGDVA